MALLNSMRRNVCLGFQVKQTEPLSAIVLLKMYYRAYVIQFVLS